MSKAPRSALGCRGGEWSQLEDGQRLSREHRNQQGFSAYIVVQIGRRLEPADHGFERAVAKATIYGARAPARDQEGAVGHGGDPAQRFSRQVQAARVRAL